MLWVMKVPVAARLGRAGPRRPPWARSALLGAAVGAAAVGAARSARANKMKLLNELPDGLKEGSYGVAALR